MSTNDYHFKGQFINEFFLQKAALLISGKQWLTYLALFPVISSL